MWGFLTCLNDILVPHLKSIFDLNYAEVMLIQFCFFSAYFVFSIPSGKIIERIGYQKMMVAGLLTMGLGALLVHSGGERALVSAVSGGADHPGGGHHRVAGFGEPIRRGAGPGAHRVQPAEPDAGIQFAGNHGRSLLWRAC